MKSRKAPVVQAERKNAFAQWHAFAILAFLLVAAFETYGPALHGPFVFDDFNLPYYKALFAQQSNPWDPGVRPLLMGSFWLNYQWSGRDTFSYHVFGLLLHLINSAFVYLIARRLLQWSVLDNVRREYASGFAASLFLLHPVATESVAYIASRSETLSAAFVLGALVLFVYRPSPAIGWVRAIGILVLYAAAVMSKEHTVVFPVILVALDLGRTGAGGLGALRQNARLYIPLLGAMCLAGLAVFRLVNSSASAGFHMAGLSHPFVYFWTQCAVFVRYVELSLFPVGQTIDYDIQWVNSPWNAWTLLGLTAMLALVAAAYVLRRRYPVSAFGILMFLTFLAPTSSFVPLADPIAEHRLYLPTVGLVLIASDALARLFTKRVTMAAVAATIVLVASIASYDRNRLWGSEAALWSDVVAKAPGKQRAYAHLVHGLVHERKCPAALALLNDLDHRGKIDRTLLVHWSYALECTEDYDGAAEKVERAARLQPDPDMYIRAATLFRRCRRIEEALQSVERAIELAPRHEAAYVLRGDLNVMRGNVSAAVKDYRRVVTINPKNAEARSRLATIMNGWQIEDARS
jgi:tetratricopeptide (TPR) repeat protein